MFSIIIPTFERHDILRRSIEYYKNFNCSVLIADSSAKKLSCKFPGNIIYRHLPDLSFTEKILKVAKTITTKYVCVTGDDDFFLESNLQRGSNFLDQNLDFVSVQGRYLKFVLTDNEITYSFKNNEEEANYAVTAEDIYSRLVRAYNPYKDQMVSMHRLNYFIKAFRSCSDITHHFMAELTTILVPMCYGKHKLLPMVWMVRDSYKFFRPNVYKNTEEESSSLSSAYFGIGGHKSIQREVSEFLESKEGKVVKEKFASEISELVSNNKESDQLFDAAFKSFDDWIVNDIRKIIIKKIIKLLTPSRVVNYYKARKKSQVTNIAEENPSVENDFKKIELSIRAFPEIYTSRRENQNPKPGTT